MIPTQVEKHVLVILRAFYSREEKGIHTTHTHHSFRDKQNTHCFKEAGRKSSFVNILIFATWYLAFTFAYDWAGDCPHLASHYYVFYAHFFFEFIIRILLLLLCLACPLRWWHFLLGFAVTPRIVPLALRCPQVWMSVLSLVVW